jgi:cation diffusion facilitator CzcD-associated flavoprotein CzcO
MPGERGLRVVIVGAGFGGLAAAIELRRHGFADVTVLERAPGIGGTWHYNGFPSLFLMYGPNTNTSGGGSSPTGPDT